MDDKTRRLKFPLQEKLVADWGDGTTTSYETVGPTDRLLGFGVAPLKTEGEHIAYSDGDWWDGPEIHERPFKPLRQWFAIRLERLADLICRDRDTGW